MMHGDHSEPVSGPAATEEPPPTTGVVIPQQRGPEMWTPPTTTAPEPDGPQPAAPPPPPGMPPPMYGAPYQTGYLPAPPPKKRRGLVIAASVVGTAIVLTLAVLVASAGSGAPAALAGAARPLGTHGATGDNASAPKGDSVSDKILAVLNKQSKALLAGDQAGYGAGIGAGLQDGFNRRFGSLRAMGVQTWKPTLVDRPSQNADGTYSTLVRWDYCFGQGCTVLFPQVVQTSWTIAGDQATIAKYEQTSEPWDASALQAVSGRRVIVAGSAASASKLQRVLTKADAAADVADRYAHWDAPPKWYIVYIAGEGEWKSWWDNGDIGASYDGYSTGPRGIVMQSADATQQWLQVLLTHEFGHVVTVGEDYGTAEQWWMTEGIADYISDRDGTTMRGRLPDVRKFVKNGWNGKITLAPPPETAPGWEIDARYGIALIAITCLSKKFTEPKMLDFWGDVVRKNMTLESASTKDLGADWAGVQSTCAGQVRNA
ncbi:hypothetical protein [Dactylosporangium sp. CA-139066]|uniref:hypothetical protein n=1 Tax=Dactylosporangium sp. CA-139066 TaxID=3239930 RepID=UPI003D8F30CC